MSSDVGSTLEASARQRHVEGDYVAALAGYEDAFARYHAEGQIEAAARAARTIGWFRGWVFGEWAIYQGWSTQSESLLARAGSRNALGWLRYGEARRGSELDMQRHQYLEAIDIARSCGDADLECEATTSLGMMLVFSGSVDEGMAHLDHALASICGGAVTELPVVEGCLCGLLNACERTHDVRRAEEWLGAADEVMRRGNLMTVAGYCRAHHAGILLAAGRWSDAEVELRSAINLLTDRSRVRESALCRMADLRLRQGRLEEARRSELEGLTNVQFLQADAQVHPFEPAAHDLVISVFGAMFFSEPAAAFGNIAQSLHPGGRLAMLSWRGFDHNEWLTTIFRTLAAGRHLPTPAPGTPGPFGLADRATVISMLAEAGFSDIELLPLDEPIWIGSDIHDAWDFVSAMGFVRGLTEGLEDATKQQALDRLRDRLAEHETADGVLMGSAAWLITATHLDLAR